MRIFTTAVCLLFAMAFAYCAQAQDRPRTKIILLDRIVAVVNDQVITRRDLDDRVNGVLSRMREQGTPLPPNDVLERQVLERMIQTRVQLQFARDTGLRIDDAALDSTIARLAANNKITVQEMRSAIEKDGIPSSEIAIVAKGKRDLLVPTKDGVKEPQNRRVQIVYDAGPNS